MRQLEHLQYAFRRIARADARARLQVPTAVQIGRCCYPASCRAPRCTVHRATIVLRKIDAAVVQFVKSSCAIAMPKALR